MNCTQLLASSLARFTGVLFGTAVLTGCGADNILPITAAEVPAPLQIVVNDKATFLTLPADPLAGVTAGALIDELSGISGCWGFYGKLGLAPGDGLSTGQQQLLDFARGWLGGRLAGEVFQGLVFDAVKGKLTKWDMEDHVGLVTIVSGARGPYTVHDGNRVRFTSEELYSSLTADGKTDSDPQFMEGHQVEFEFKVTLKGEYLKIDFSAEKTEPHPEDILTYVRFDCPVESLGD